MARNCLKCLERVKCKDCERADAATVKDAIALGFWILIFMVIALFGLLALDGYNRSLKTGVDPLEAFKPYCKTFLIEPLANGSESLHPVTIINASKQRCLNVGGEWFGK